MWILSFNIGRSWRRPFSRATRWTGTSRTHRDHFHTPTPMQPTLSFSLPPLSQYHCMPRAHSSSNEPYCPATMTTRRKLTTAVMPESWDVIQTLTPNTIYRNSPLATTALLQTYDYFCRTMPVACRYFQPQPHSTLWKPERIELQLRCREFPGRCNSI